MKQFTHITEIHKNEMKKLLKVSDLFVILKSWSIPLQSFSSKKKDIKIGKI